MIGTSIRFKIRHEFLICLMLVITTYFVYRQVISHSFVIYDDGLYITENLRVQAGLTLENLFWSFSTHHAGNWHPLTWISHMLDVEFFGLNAGGHHLTNVFFHILNSLLVFLVLRRMTGDIWQSGFVAALFALHPLHVESVAWVSERKDVLSTFFGLFIIVAWGIPHILDRWRFKTVGMILGASVILLICTTAARFQTSIWANSITLFEHALEVTENNALAHNMLAYSLSEKGELDEAVRHIYTGLKIQPVNAGAYNNLGNIRMQQGKVDEAIRHFNKALQIHPNKEDIHYNLANALMAQGKTADAIHHYDVALGLNPDI